MPTVLGSGVARQVPPLAVDVRVDDEHLVIVLSDGRELRA